MKTALITGSTKGIGREIGLDLLNRDYHVTFNYAHDTKGAELLRKQLDDPRLPRIKGDYQIIRADLSYIEELEKITKDITKLDVLILNTGITDRTPFGEIKESEWNKVFNTNLTVPFFLIQTLKDKINPNGKIIFVSSISGIIPDSISISYGVSKAAINMLVPYLAKEFAEKKNNEGIITARLARTFVINFYFGRDNKDELSNRAFYNLAGNEANEKYLNLSHEERIKLLDFK